MRLGKGVVVNGIAEPVYNSQPLHDLCMADRQ